jgi:hypothetical protein
VSFARMSNVLEQTKQQQVVALGRLAWPVSRISAAVHVDRATVTRYLRAAGVAARRRGRPSEATANAAIIGRVVSTDLPANPAISPPVVSTDSAPSRAPRSSACEPHRERIEAAVRVGRNARAIWQDLVEDLGFPARYASVVALCASFDSSRRRRRASSSPPRPAKRPELIAPPFTASVETLYWQGIATVRLKKLDSEFGPALWLFADAVYDFTK